MVSVVVAFEIVSFAPVVEALLIATLANATFFSLVTVPSSAVELNDAVRVAEEADDRRSFTSVMVMSSCPS